VFEDIHQRKMALEAQTNDQESAQAEDQYKKLMDEEDKRLKEILTPEQFTKYQQLKALHAAKKPQYGLYGLRDPIPGITADAYAGLPSKMIPKTQHNTGLRQFLVGD